MLQKNKFNLKKPKVSGKKFGNRVWFYTVRIFIACIFIAVAYSLQINITNYAYSVTGKVAYAKQMSILSTTIIFSILSAWFVTLIAKLNWHFDKSKLYKKEQEELDQKSKNKGDTKK